MSETAYERGYRVASEHASTGGGGGGGSSPSSARASTGARTVLFRQMGALPMWAWLVLGLVLILGISYWKNRKNATTAGSTQTTATNDIPQFVNQVYTNPAPPEEPGPTGPAGPPGPKGPPGPPAPKPKPKTPVNVASFRYTVQKGDTLLSISQKFLGTTNRTALAHANGLGTGAGLRAGQILIIPAHKSPPGAPAPVNTQKGNPGAVSGGSGGGGEGED